MQCCGLPFAGPGPQRGRPAPRGLFGRKAASVGDFVYSPPHAPRRLCLDAGTARQFLAEPQSPPFRGNRMPFAGMPDAQARADLIAYLKEATR